MKKHIPNSLTCCNLICGCMATGAAFYGNYQYAVLMIVIGAVFDFLCNFNCRVYYSYGTFVVIFCTLGGCNLHRINKSFLAVRNTCGNLIIESIAFAGFQIMDLRHRTLFICKSRLRNIFALKIINHEYICKLSHADIGNCLFIHNRIIITIYRLIRRHYNFYLRRRYTYVNFLFVAGTEIVCTNNYSFVVLIEFKHSAVHSELNVIIIRVAFNNS